MSEILSVSGEIQAADDLAQKLAVTAFDFFQDAPTSDAIDPATFTAKLKSYLLGLKATYEEVNEACKRLDRRVRFRPRAADIEAEVLALRAEVRDREFRAQYNGSKMMVDVRGIEVLVKGGDVEAMLDLGWTLPVPKERTVDEVRELLQDAKPKEIPNDVEEDLRKLAAIDELRRKR